ncbi:DUF3267 domain-containing protein [Gracilibacillus caseinilyticus]|uniref:DUF3267 domain-containing protein n=1 Tax=Gracilibacillus caseinilyticus TaxID=2932256 RepID=A0ABY4ERF4_9BACI|nr:DUF3267 domain-containing protein [Gracilibacillus caseinilyticus]UOQ46804.1 DUF3267 domain-containing protein [Gracilibacillus caseinilyticus]
MNCWDSINVTKQLGFYRSIILSFLFGLLSFIFLYLPFNLIHKGAVVEDHGIIPLLIGLAILPLLHKILRILPLLFINKQLKLIWTLEKGIFPNFRVCNNTKTNKPTLFIALLTPTIVITLPCIIYSYFAPAHYPYFLLFGAINLSLSYIDFLFIRHLWRAPKKCVISNDDTGYDILIQR